MLMHGLDLHAWRRALKECFFEVGHDEAAELRHRDDLEGLLHLHADLLDPDEDVRGDKDPEADRRRRHRAGEDERQPKPAVRVSDSSVA